MRKSKSAGADNPEGVGWSSLHEIYIGYEVGYTSGGIRFAAKGTAKPAEQGTRKPGRVPGIPHEETARRDSGPTHMETMIKGPRLRSVCEESVGNNRHLMP